MTQDQGDFIFHAALTAVWEEVYEDDLSFYGGIRIMVEVANGLLASGWDKDRADLSPLMAEQLKQIATRALSQAGRKRP